MNEGRIQTAGDLEFGVGIDLVNGDREKPARVIGKRDGRLLVLTLEEEGVLMITPYELSKVELRTGEYQRRPKLICNGEVAGEKILPGTDPGSKTRYAELITIFQFGGI